MKKLNWKNLKPQAFFLPAAALLLLLLALVFSKQVVVRSIFAALSLLVSLYTLLPQMKEALRTKDLRSGLLLLVLAALLWACTGRVGGAALAMLLFSAAQPVMEWLKGETLSQITEHSAQSPLHDELPKLSAKPGVTAPKDRMLQLYFPAFALLLAALAMILTVRSAQGTIGSALRRAAVLLALGGTANFFAAFPYGDLAASVAAAEKGVLFRGDSLSRLSELQLCCAEAQKPVFRENAVIYSAMPEKLSGDTLLRLASLALSRTQTPWTEPLRSLCAPASGNVKAQLLSGFGVVAKAESLSILCGSAEFMRKAGLTVYPFPRRDSILHIAVNGTYAGCIDFEGSDAARAEEAAEQAGFYCFAEEAAAKEQRQPGEAVVFLSPEGFVRSAEEGDLFAGLGIAAPESDLILERCGRCGLFSLAEQLRRVQLLRKGLLLLQITVRAVLLLMALIGVCPLWLAVFVQLLADGFSLFYSLRALDDGARF